MRNGQHPVNQGKEAPLKRALARVGLCFDGKHSLLAVVETAKHVMDRYKSKSTTALPPLLAQAALVLLGVVYIRRIHHLSTGCYGTTRSTPSKSIASSVPLKYGQIVIFSGLLPIPL